MLQLQYLYFKLGEIIDITLKPIEWQLLTRNPIVTYDIQWFWIEIL